jgi:retron-type reverse transcriptase
LGVLNELNLIYTQVRVKVNNENTEVEFGVKQGDPLSANLFGVVVHVILKHLDLGRNISTLLKKCSA